MTSSWREFWNTENRIYVSEKHLRAYYEELGKGILSLIPDKRPLIFLDWGCGEAHAAPRLVASGVQVLLHDPVPRMHERITERFAGTTGITILSEERLVGLPAGSVDIIFVYSVLQYITEEEFSRVLGRFHELLAPDGLLIIGDVVPPATSMLEDIGDLLRAALVYGFLVKAVLGMARTFFSEYRLIRKTNGFTTYTEAGFLALLKNGGFSGSRMPSNIGLGRHRMLFTAHKT